MRSRRAARSCWPRASASGAPGSWPGAPAPPPGPELLRAAYLVDRADVDGFVAVVRELQREHDSLSVLCTGPWPPYSFAGEPG